MSNGGFQGSAARGSSRLSRAGELSRDGAVMSELPLFPLKTVLFPGGLLALRDVRAALSRHGRALLARRQSLRRGRDPRGLRGRRRGHVRRTARRAEIVDWHQESGGMLGISRRGPRELSRRREHAPDRTASTSAASRCSRSLHARRCRAAHAPLATLLRQSARAAAGATQTRPRSSTMRFGSAGV